MKKTALFTSLMFASLTAFAFHCPADMKKIDEALAKKPTLSEKDMTEVKQLRANAERLQEPEVVALCDEVLGGHAKASAARRSKPKKEH